MTTEKKGRPSLLAEFIAEFPGVWRSIPEKRLFGALFLIWVLLFHFLGNSTLGYINTRSLFVWANYSYSCSVDDQHGPYIPLLVLALCWWKRKELGTLQTRLWLPGISIVIAALFLHIGGYVAQQTRISLAGFFLGLYGLVGLVWGRGALKATFFPMCLFAFALPLNTLAETITFPLRLLATKTSCFLAGDVLGIDIVQRGTQISDAHNSFQFEVAAACSGLRSLTAILALSTIYGFMNFVCPGRILLMIASGFPLAIAANVVRLLTIIIVSEAFGQKAGITVHDSAWFSLLPYVPAILGVVVIGHFLKESPAREKAPLAPVEQPA